MMGHEGNGGWRLGDLISPTLVRASQPTPDLRGHGRARNGGRGRRLKIVSLIILAAISILILPPVEKPPTRRSSLPARRRRTTSRCSPSAGLRSASALSRTRPRCWSRSRRSSKRCSCGSRWVSRIGGKRGREAPRTCFGHHDLLVRVGRLHDVPVRADAREAASKACAGDDGRGTKRW